MHAKQLQNQTENVLNDLFDISIYQQKLKLMKSIEHSNFSGWVVKTGAQFIDMFVRIHKPDIVYLTTGFHGWLNGKSEFAKREAREFESRIPLWKEKYGIQTKMIFRSTTFNAAASKVTTPSYKFDAGAIRLANLGVWEYWNISSTLERMYWVYRRIETPFVYFNQNISSRGFFIDPHHYAPWVYNEMNKAFIIKYILKP